MIYRTRGENTNHYANDAFSYEKEAVAMAYLRNCIFIVHCNDPSIQVSIQE